MAEKIEEIFDGIIGATEDLAKQKCGANGFTYRITRRDGTYFVCTRDVRADRMNLHIEDGVVVEAYIG